MRRRPTRKSIVDGVVLACCAAVGAGVLLRPEFSDAELDSAAPMAMDLGAPATETVSMEQSAGLRQVATRLETELDRLDAASQKLESTADQLFGPEVDGARKLKLPEDHDGLMRYLKQSVSFVDGVVHSFGDLVAGEDEVDLQERVPEARKRIARLEKSGVASMLARRQIRAWIEKDMKAVEALCADWDRIEPNARQLIQTARKYDEGQGSLTEIVNQHKAVLESADTRTQFEKTKLGMLCRRTVEGAREIDRERRSGLARSEPTPSSSVMEPN